MKRIGYLLAFVPLSIGFLIICIAMIFIVPGLFIVRLCDGEPKLSGIEGDFTFYPRPPRRRA